tara:strand:- start:22672 stop:22941 length:270 start_codon:yes stop_codon:yes gene_type:complete
MYNKYTLTAKVTISTYTTVEAESLSEAIKVAEDRDIGIGGINSGLSSAESWVVEDIDGMPYDIYMPIEIRGEHEDTSNRKSSVNYSRDR